VELGKCGTIPASRIESISGGEVERDHLLSVCRPCGHTRAFHNSGGVPFARGIRFEGQMQDGIVTTESSPSRMGSVGRTPTGCHSGMGTGVHTLQSCSIYSYSRVLGHGQSLEDMFVPHDLGFLPPPVGESVVSRGCSQLEERGSIYLVDPIAIIEVRGEKVLASTLDRSRLWRRGPG
jgi:hypothetical protein